MEGRRLVSLKWKVDVEERKAECITCGGGFIPADVIRWRELAWREVRWGPAQAVNTGEQMVVAAVLEVNGEWVELMVRGCTVEKGKPERFLWSDESVSALLISLSPKPDNPAPC